MSAGKIPFLCLVFLTVGCSVFSTEKPSGKAPSPAAPGPGKTYYFQNSGSQIDSLLDRIRFKISYSWGKSGEYFRLACSSITDSVPAKARDVESRISVKKEELLEQGRQAVRETAGQAGQKLSEKGQELKEDLKKMGEEVQTEAAKEFRKNTDQLLK